MLYVEYFYNICHIFYHFLGMVWKTYSDAGYYWFLAQGKKDILSTLNEAKDCYSCL